MVFGKRDIYAVKAESRVYETRRGGSSKNVSFISSFSVVKRHTYAVIPESVVYET